MHREGLTDKVAFEERPEGSERVSHVDFWRKNIPGREDYKCKDPKCKFSWKNTKRRGPVAGAVRGQSGRK